MSDHIAEVVELVAYQTCRICVAGTPDWEPNPVAVTCWCGAVACVSCMDGWHWRYYDCRTEAHAQQGGSS